MESAGRLNRRCFSGFYGASGMQMRALAVEFLVVHGHPNRLPF